jgi:hypothetical protein
MEFEKIRSLNWQRNLTGTSSNSEKLSNRQILLPQKHMSKGGFGIPEPIRPKKAKPTTFLRLQQWSKWPIVFGNFFLRPNVMALCYSVAIFLDRK